MRFVLLSCLALGCATTSATVVGLTAPQVETWPSGWQACSAEETKEQLAAPPLEPDESCGLGHAGCAALRAQLLPCSGLGPGRLTVLASTDATGAVVGHCLAAASAQVPPETLACVDQAFRDLGARAAASREQAAVRIELYPNWVYVADGSGLQPAAVNQTLSAAADAIAACKSDGSVELAWKIAADGSVSEVAVRSPQHQGSAPAACLSAVLGQLKFPAHGTASDDPYLLRL
ncbi:MAG: hypothetical protein IPJ65_23650 [Archangiaceae bacterium]|nr:hypothetical protein [Archangiaceae bacterium]